MNEQETRELRDNIMNGLNLSFQRMVQEKKRTNSDLVFASKGKMVKIKATEL